MSLDENDEKIEEALELAREKSEEYKTLLKETTEGGEEALMKLMSELGHDMPEEMGEDYDGEEPEEGEATLKDGADGE